MKMNVNVINPFLAAGSELFKENEGKNVIVEIIQFKQYIQLKTALVNTNAEKASQEASNLMTAFANVGVENVALQAAQNIVESNDIKEQRTAFVAVTTEVEKMMEDALSSGTIYKQYCPMAFNNKGAYWLSESEDIMNPYFGDKMLKCGRVDAEIQ